jgi:hypothetical protein
MKRTALVVVTGLIATLGVNGPAWAQEQPVLPILPQAQLDWNLIRDFNIDGKIEEAECTVLQLSAKGNELSGHFADKKALESDNGSIFSGEVVTREKSLLILKQSLSSNGGYVLIHTGLQVGANHYRGTWHDNGGKSGDFELKLKK